MRRSRNRPGIIRVRANALRRSAPVNALVDEVRAAADGFVFLSGGASKMRRATQRGLIKLIDALAMLADDGLRIAVGDGGTKAGLMEAAGRARRRSGNAFPLVGVSPAPEVLPVGRKGKTPIDPHHSHIVATDNPDWVRRKRRSGWRPADGYWGAEIEPMYQLFARLARGRPAITIVANGGGGTLEEVRCNLRQRRRMIVIAGSGRAADAIIAVLRNRTPRDPEARHLRDAAAKLALRAHRDLIEVFPLRRGPRRLAQLLVRRLSVRRR
jgi:hypothetical protein